MFVQKGTGRLIVSTVRHKQETSPRTLKYIRVGQAGKPESYINLYPHRCYAFDPEGSVVWELRDLTANAESPNGTLVGVADRTSLAMVDGTGRLLERKEMSVRWEIAGWNDDGTAVVKLDGPPSVGPGKPSTSPPMEKISWVGDVGYAVFGESLVSYDRRGRTLSQVPFPSEAVLNKRHAAAETIVTFGPWHLTYDPYHDRMIAASQFLPAWVVALGTDGYLHWVALVGRECCHFPCIILNESIMVHASSCGRRLTYLSPDGAVCKVRSLEKPALHLIRDGAGGVCLTFLDGGLASFDARGEPRWTLDAGGNVREALIHEQKLYVVIETRAGELILKASDL